MTRWGRFVTTVVVAATTVTLAACTTAPAEPKPVPTKPASTSSATPSATPPPLPELVPGGSAEDNLEYFDHVNTTLLASGSRSGRAIIDNLVAAGFDKAAMEVTPDRTPLGYDVDSLQFSVQLGAECLLGQTGAGGYTSMVGPALASGGCLVGQTRPINW